VAGFGGGGRGDEDGALAGEDEPEGGRGGRGAAGSGAPGAEGTEEDARSGEAAARVRVVITARRVRIDPAGKREEYVGRLERLIGGLDGLLADPGLDEAARLKAVDVIIRAVRMCYLIVRDVDVERMERELEKLKEEAETAGSELGYRAEDPSP
jgi:hypothetical protein